MPVIAPAVRVDRGCWPLVLSVFNGQQESKDVDYYIGTMDAIYEAGEPFLAVSFMLRYRSDYAQLRRIADWTRAHADIAAELCCANAVVAPSMGFRFLFTTFVMLQPMPCPY